MSYVNVLLFTSAIVVALMAMYAYDNKRRMVEILAKLDRSDELDDTRAMVQKSADEAILLKTKLTDVQKNADEKSEMVVYLQEQLKKAETTTEEVKQHILNLRENLEEEKSKHKDTRKQLEEAKPVDHLHIAEKVAEKVADKVVELLSNRFVCKQDKENNDDNKGLEEKKGQCKVKRPSDCMDLDKSTCKSGIYKIYPENTSGFNVFCEMDYHGGGWTVIQRRMNGKINFYRNWESYKTGFGNMNEEHWLGNDHLHQLTSQGKYMLRIDMSDFENSKRHAVYSKFSVGSEGSGYTLDVTGYSGDTGDAMNHQNGHKFSTMDNDNDVQNENCAVKFKGGWWYNHCHESNLNGLYLKGNHKSFADGVNWYQWKGYNYSLKTTIMIIRRT